MKAITIPQPWAWALLSGATSYRSVAWSTAYRGLVAIVAGVDLRRLRSDHSRIRRVRPGFRPPMPYRCGCILGLMYLIDCRPAKLLDDPDAFCDGPYCLHLIAPEIYETPVPFRGRPGLFEIDDRLLPSPAVTPIDGKLAACGS